MVTITSFGARPPVFSAHAPPSDPIKPTLHTLTLDCAGVERYGVFKTGALQPGIYRVKSKSRPSVRCSLDLQGQVEIPPFSDQQDNRDKCLRIQYHYFPLLSGSAIQAAVGRCVLARLAQHASSCSTPDKPSIANNVLKLIRPMPQRAEQLTSSSSFSTTKVVNLLQEHVTSVGLVCVAVHPSGLYLPSLVFQDIYWTCPVERGESKDSGQSCPVFMSIFRVIGKLRLLMSSFCHSDQQDSK